MKVCYFSPVDILFDSTIMRLLGSLIATPLQWAHSS